MKHSLWCVGGTALAVGLLSATARADSATDAGPTDATQPVTVSLILKVRDADGLEQFVAQTQDPGSNRYHRFLSVSDFVDRFAPSDHDIKKIKQYLNQNAITVTDVYADHLVIKATGTVAAFNAVFSADLHDYDDHGHKHHRPHHQPSIPLLLKDLLYVVAGLDESATYKPHSVNGNVAVPFAARQAVLPAGNTTATGVPGSYTVGDVANLYNVNPLYAQHIDGRGRTIGIATLASFLPSDAYAYWNAIGLTVKPNRITQVHVDGGGVVSGPAGSGETSLDVEQSGGLAPQANIVVYDAPNSDAGFIDVFYRAASDNLVDTLSVSWGNAEALYYAAVEGGVDYTGELKAFHQAFLESAAQGISLFAASGDAGAYDLNRGQGFMTALTVDAPGNDPAITSAGGTTVPATMDFGGPTPLVVAHEQVWGWSYLATYFATVLGRDITSLLFPTGGGGGVSTFWAKPEYQAHTPGMQLTAANQTVTLDLGNNQTQFLMALPANFAGRNVPDVSLDADPETGFLVYSTPDDAANPLFGYYGGTSFVAPQLNGITALLGQAAGGRLGLINPMLYRFQHQAGYGAGSPLRDITAGDDWFYTGVAGYEPGAGLGVLDVANLAAAIKSESGSCHH